jgi:hypothetical protein
MLSRFDHNPHKFSPTFNIVKCFVTANSLKLQEPLFNEEKSFSGGSTWKQHKMAYW